MKTLKRKRGTGRTDASKFFGDKDYYFASFWAVWQINSGVTLPPKAAILSPDLHQMAKLVLLLSIPRGSAVARQSSTLAQNLDASTLAGPAERPARGPFLSVVLPGTFSPTAAI